MRQNYSKLLQFGELSQKYRKVKEVNPYSFDDFLSDFFLELIGKVNSKTFYIDIPGASGGKHREHLCGPNHPTHDVLWEYLEAPACHSHQ